MALTEHYHTKFEEGLFFHVYNRSVDKKALFRHEDNYKYFLKKFDQYLTPVLDTFAYCLLGNHFHFLVRVKDLTTFQKLSNLDKQPNLNNQVKSPHEIVSHQFRKFFQSYAMAFNKQQDRTGTLFQTPFKRALIDHDHYLNHLFYYIHANPQLNNLTDDFRKWRWSSYHRLLRNKPSNLKKAEVLEWFGNSEAYEQLRTVPCPKPADDLPGKIYAGKLYQSGLNIWDKSFKTSIKLL